MATADTIRGEYQDPDESPRLRELLQRIERLEQQLREIRGELSVLAEKPG